MPLFYVTWKFHADKKSESMTYFASMTEEDFARDSGDKVKVYGRWHHLGTHSGQAIAEATAANDIFTWAYNWSEDACEVEVVPIMDDNKLKEMVLRREPPVLFSYDRANYEPQDDETLYISKYQFRDVASRISAYDIACNMSWEEDMEANGTSAFQHLGRWHVPSEGWGIVVGVTKDHNALFHWAKKWEHLGGDINFTPVLTDKAAAKIIREKPGYEQKLSKIHAKFAQA